MKLITETSADLQCIVEAKENGEKAYYVTGPYINTEIQNRNGRYYPKSVIESQLGRQLELIKENRALGELNHPNSPSVNPERACHLIKELKWDGNDVIGKSKVLHDLPCGKIVAGLMRESIGFGMSTRGMGSVKKNSRGMNEVMSDFRLVCVDLVIDPSGPSCWVQGIMEGVEWLYNESTDSFYEKKIEDTQQVIEAAVRSRTLDSSMKMKLFESWLKTIS